MLPTCLSKGGRLVGIGVAYPKTRYPQNYGLTVSPPDAVIRSMFTLTQQVNAVRREIAMRKSVYTKQVARGAMTQATADFQIGCMIEVEKTLLNLINLRETDSLLPY